MERLNPGSFYAIWCENASGATPCVDLARLADLLPHGSGIDGDYYIRVRKNGNIEIRSEFHGMDEWGSYNGWTPFTIRVYRLTKNEQYDLSDNFYQLVGRKGEVDMEVKAPAELRDYLYDVVYESIKSLVSKPSYADNCFGPNGRRAQFNKTECKWEETT